MQGGQGLEYLKNPVGHVLRPESEAFDGHTRSQVVSYVNVCKSAITANGTDRQRPLLQRIRSRQLFAVFAQLVQQVQTLFPELLVKFWYRSGLQPTFSSPTSRRVTVMQSNNAYLINNVDETLSFFASKASRESDTGRGVYEGSDYRNEFSRGGIGDGRCR